MLHPPPDLKTEETIRLIGVDTPETVHPDKPVQDFGPEASAFTKEQLQGKQVYLAFDWDLRDRYGRLLAYVYTEDGTCFNARLIQEGYAYAYLSFRFQFMEEFAGLEQTAREQHRGLWGSAAGLRQSLGMDRVGPAILLSVTFLKRNFGDIPFL
jgi:micrococcal nuclease